jgi:EAL domain-containing protein (putative c-di-GMP-specific phosphodiesterase class I)
MECHFAQGFYFSKPVPAEAAVAFLAKPAAQVIAA